MQVLPLTSDPANTITVALNGTKYDVFTRYNEQAFWTLDLMRKSDGVTLVAGEPILLGFDILGPFARLGIGGLIATDLGGTDTEAGPDDLGSRVIVTYFTPGELAVLKSAGYYL